MDLVSNFAGQISASMFGENAQAVTPKLDLNDKTFADLLEKQLEKTMENNLSQAMNNFSIPTGIDIGEFDGNKTDLNKINAIDSSKSSDFQKFNKNDNFTTSEVLTFFPSLFNSKPTQIQTLNSGFLDFERKLATASYGRGARNIITDVSEFVSDALKLS